MKSLLALVFLAGVAAAVLADEWPLMCGETECRSHHLCDLWNGCDADGQCMWEHNSCHDNVMCTEDWCESDGCHNEPRNDWCWDDDECTVDLCDGYECKHEAVNCDEHHPDHACETFLGCDRYEGCKFTEKACDDHVACTEDWCAAEHGGACIFNPVDSNCDDNNVCTIEKCHPEQGCVQVGNLDCELSEHPCEIFLGCDSVEGCKFVEKTCDDYVDCTEDWCAAEYGGACMNNPVDGNCDDNDACTVDYCHETEGCKHETLNCHEDHPDYACMEFVGCHAEEGCKFVEKDCSDNNDCTEDWCAFEHGGQCMHSPDDGLCDDDNHCTWDTCTDAGCDHEPVTCYSDYVCDVFVECKPHEGCVFEHNKCDDNDRCTEDWCNDDGCHNEPIDGCAEPSDH